MKSRICRGERSRRAVKQPNVAPKNRIALKIHLNRVGGGPLFGLLEGKRPLATRWLPMLKKTHHERVLNIFLGQVRGEKEGSRSVDVRVYTTGYFWNTEAQRHRVVFNQLVFKELFSLCLCASVLKSKMSSSVVRVVHTRAALTECGSKLSPARCTACPAASAPSP